MDIEHLSMFCEIYRLRSVSRAAQRLFMSQQALSRQLKNWEAELGVPLFSRTTAGVEPTADADVLYEVSQDILVSWRSALGRLSNLTPRDDPKVRMGIVKGAFRGDGGRYLDKIVADCRSSGFELLIEDRDGVDCAGMVVDGTFGCSLLFSTGLGNSLAAGIRARTVCNVPLYVASKIGTCPPEPGTGDSTAIGPDEFGSMRLACTNEETRAWTLGAARALGCSRIPELVWTNPNTLNLDAFIRSYCSGVVCWKSLLPEGGRDASFRLFEIPGYSLELMFVWNPSRLSDKEALIILQAFADAEAQI